MRLLRLTCIKKLVTSKSHMSILLTTIGNDKCAVVDELFLHLMSQDELIKCYHFTKAHEVTTPFHKNTIRLIFPYLFDSLVF